MYRLKGYEMFPFIFQFQIYKSRSINRNYIELLKLYKIFSEDIFIIEIAQEHALRYKRQ